MRGSRPAVESDAEAKLPPLWGQPMRRATSRPFHVGWKRLYLGLHEDRVLYRQRPMSESGVRREKAALSRGCKTHPATAPAGSNRSSYGGDEIAEAFGMRVTTW